MVSKKWEDNADAPMPMSLIALNRLQFNPIYQLIQLGFRVKTRLDGIQKIELFTFLIIIEIFQFFWEKDSTPVQG